jgi:hypothetical protein
MLLRYREPKQRMSDMRQRRGGHPTPTPWKAIRRAGGALALAPAIASALALAAVPASAALLDHHAIYDVTLEGAAPGSVEGRAEILVRRDCEQWNYVFFLDMTAGQGLDATHVEIRQDYAEALDHATLLFRTRFATGDTGATRAEGQVNFSDGEKPAQVKVQRDEQVPQSAELPSDTIGKVQSILGLTGALAQGAERAAFTIFDTRALSARLVEATTAAEPLPGAVDGAKVPEGASWPLVVTLRDSQTSEQRFLRLHESGVILWFRRTLATGVNVTGRLIELDLSERQSCE